MEVNCEEGVAKVEALVEEGRDLTESLRLVVGKLLLPDDSVVQFEQLS